VFILEFGKGVGDLGRLGGCGRSNNQTIGVEGSPSTGELFHSRAQVAGCECLVVLALDHDVSTIRLTTGKVDSVLRLPLNPIPAELDLPEPEFATRNRQYELLESIPADVEVQVPV
jgi:hypothetical protein